MLLLLSGCLVLPLITALAYGELSAAGAFCVTITICLIPAIVIKYVFQINIAETSLKMRESYILVATTWIVASVVGCIPYLLTGSVTNFFDAFFETASGFTTTGSSIMTSIDTLPKSILMWRSFTQWLGGMGIVVLFVALLPGIGVKARNIAQAETPGPTVTRLTTHYTGTAQRLYLLYIGLTVGLIVLLLGGGMSLFDAVNHAFTTMATGGFSTHGDSIAYFNSNYITWVLTIFMFIAGSNFELFFIAYKSGINKALKNEEYRLYIFIVVASILGITVNLMAQGGYENFGHSLTDAAFQVTTVISTTGYATTDFALWPSFSKAILLILMFTGGCSSSTAGGIKMIRIVLLFKMFIREVKIKLHGKIVRDVKLDGRKMTSEMVTFLIGFTSMYIITLISGTFIISLVGDGDLITNFTAVLTCISNVGPGFGAVGPVCNFAFYSGFSKIILSLIMIAGRLELSTFFIIFTRFLQNPDKI